MKKILLIVFIMSVLIVSAQGPTLTETKIQVCCNTYSSTAIADINADGNLDVVVTQSDIGSVDIFYGDGNFNFPNSQTIQISAPNVGTNLRSAEVIDWDFDGDLDILVADFENSTNRGVKLITNTGINTSNSGITTSVSSLFSSTRIFDIAVGNFTGSLFPDLAMLHLPSNTQRFTLYEAFGGTTSSTLTSIFVKNGLSSPSNLKIADTDNDGDLDFVFSDVQNNRIRRFKSDGTDVTAETGFNLTEPRESAFADLNGDGIPEHIYITSNANSAALSYRVTNTDGSLTTATTISNLNSGSRGFGVAASDFDNDGDIDIIATDFSNTTANTNPVKYFQNTGTNTSPTFIERTVPFTGDKTGVRAVFVADFDNDGNDDFLVEDRTLGQFIIYRDDTLPTLSTNSPNIVSSIDVYPNPKTKAVLEKNEIKCLI